MPKTVGILKDAQQSTRSMRMQEKSENVQRSINMQEQTKVIRFNQKEIPVFKPKKFVPGAQTTKHQSWSHFEDSNKIKPKWTPSDSETDEPAYKKIRPALHRMSDEFKGKIHSFAGEFREKSNNPKREKLIKIERSDELAPTNDENFAYRDEKRSSQMGKEVINASTGLVYFKYDFGYEFGVVVPNDKSMFRKSVPPILEPAVGSDVSYTEPRLIWPPWARHKWPVDSTVLSGFLFSEKSKFVYKSVHINRLDILNRVYCTK